MPDHDSFNKERIKMNTEQNVEHPIKGMYELAAKHNGTCLSSEFKGYRERLTWRCGKGHVWESLPLNVKSGHWCPICGRERMAEKKRKKGLEDLKTAVKKRKGEILSRDEDYVNTIRKLRFRCEQGHEWETRPAVVKSGHWCPICMTKGRKKFDVSALRELAAKRGGACLSSINMGFKIKHRWQCSLGHEWEAFPWAVKRGNWCPKCARKGRPPGSRNKPKKELQKILVLNDKEGRSQNLNSFS